jgi:hypothetical protein
MERPVSAAAKYEDFYTWSHPYGDHVIAHTDGAVSTLIEWDGIDCEMMTEQERAARWSTLYTVLSSLGVGYCAEFHWWRELDATLADEYRARGDDMVRGHAFARALRDALADHLTPYALSNRVALVLTKLPPKRVFLGAKRELRHQGEDAQTLLSKARTLLANLPGGHIASVQRYLARVRQSFDREAHARGGDLRHDPRFLLSEQLLRSAPVLERDGLVRVGRSYTKTLFVFLYPEAKPGWFLGLASLPIAMHACLTVIPVNTKTALKSSERASDLAEGSIGHRGRDTHLQTIGDLAGFRAFVAEHGLSIFKNCFVIHLHGDPEELRAQAQLLCEWVERQGGQVRDSDYVQLPYLRCGQPGQGYRSPVFRTDHTWQVAHMLPLQVYGQGDARPESLRLGNAGQLIGFSLSSETVPHSFTVAMTGGGKGVDKVATIAESYPFGIDWYIAEIGGSYKWIVEAFGGVYNAIDPNETIVNPLPPYAAANPATELPLDAVLAGGTVNSLAFLLTDGRTELSVHQQAAAQAALQLLYSAPKVGQHAPLLPDFYGEIEQLARDIDNAEQRDACRTMAANLHSFMETTEGRIFTRPDNLTLSEGITGVDLKEVDRASPKLLKFYLVFLALRFNHLAFARRTPARVLLDEIHKFVAVAPEVIGRLVSELARMGRKDAAAIDIVTQGTREIDAIEAEVINSMPLRSLLYRSDEWDEIAQRINMPPGPLQLWKDFPYPINLPWRPALRSVGPRYYHCHLTFPHLILDLAASGPQDLDLKDEIGARVHDPLERLTLFRERRA